MTHYSDRRQTPWIGKLVISIFLLVLGGMANQFWNIPRQDYRMGNIERHMEEIEKHLEYSDRRMDTFSLQHEAIERKLEVLSQFHQGKGKHIPSASASTVGRR